MKNQFRRRHDEYAVKRLVRLCYRMTSACHDHPAGEAAGGADHYVLELAALPV
jgi:hypothetical protein